MGLIFWGVISLILGIIFTIIAVKLDGKTYKTRTFVFEIVCIVLAIVFYSAFVIMLACFLSELPAIIHPDLTILEYKETAYAYSELLTEYKYSDIIASNDYIELYQDIIKYNKKVRLANKYQGKWWLEYLFFNPIYTGLPLIEF